MSGRTTRSSPAAESRSETLENRSVPPPTANEAANDGASNRRSETTQADLTDTITEQRDMLKRQSKLIQTILSTRSQKTEVFTMVAPAHYCGGAPELGQFLNQLRMNFNSHGDLFPRGDSDRVQYALNFLRAWTDHTKPDLRQTRMTDPSEWASSLLSANGPCLQNWDLFEVEIESMYGDRNRRIGASTRAIEEYAQGHHGPETVRAYANRVQSNWREAG